MILQEGLFDTDSTACWDGGMFVGHWIWFSARVILLIGCAFSARAERVTVEYEAEASTVVGQPFGLKVPRLTRVRGIFSYESSAVDTRPDDPRRGGFSLGPGSWEFEARFLDHTLLGSSQAWASTETFGYSLRFNDGGDRDDTRDMSFDGVTRSDLALGFSIVGSAAQLPTDQLPAPFLYQPGNPHTFVIEDASGRMLLQFLSVNQIQVSAPDLEVISINLSTDEITISWTSASGESYQLESSSNLTKWTPVGNPVAATGGETSATAAVDSSDRSFYRVRRLAAP